MHRHSYRSYRYSHKKFVHYKIVEQLRKCRYVHVPRIVNGKMYDPLIDKINEYSLKKKAWFLGFILLLILYAYTFKILWFENNFLYRVLFFILTPMFMCLLLIVLIKSLGVFSYMSLNLEAQLKNSTKAKWTICGYYVYVTQRDIPNFVMDILIFLMMYVLIMVLPNIILSAFVGSVTICFLMYFILIFFVVIGLRIYYMIINFPAPRLCKTLYFYGKSWAKVEEMCRNMILDRSLGISRYQQNYIFIKDKIILEFKNGIDVVFNYISGKLIKVTIMNITEDNAQDVEKIIEAIEREYRYVIEKEHQSVK